MFVHLLVRFRTLRGMDRRWLWLPNTRGPRDLIRRRSLFVCLPRDALKEALVASLYASSDELRLRVE
jgi:hypothetical protein